MKKDRKKEVFRLFIPLKDELKNAISLLLPVFSILLLVGLSLYGAAELAKAIPLPRGEDITFSTMFDYIPIWLSVPLFLLTIFFLVEPPQRKKRKEMNDE